MIFHFQQKYIFTLCATHNSLAVFAYSGIISKCSQQVPILYPIYENIRYTNKHLQLTLKSKYYYYYCYHDHMVIIIIIISFIYTPNICKNELTSQSILYVHSIASIDDKRRTPRTVANKFMHTNIIIIIMLIYVEEKMLRNFQYAETATYLSGRT